MRKSWIVVAVLTAAPINSALAQGEKDDVHLRNRCRQYAHYLEMGPKHPHYQEALSGIDECDEAGGAVLAALWDTMAAADSATVGQLTRVSSRFRDRGLLDGLLIQIADVSRPRPVRIAMLRVLVSYYAPGRTLPSGAAEGRTDPEYCMLGQVTHFEARDGATPLTAADRARIMQVINSLATGDSDSTVRAAAACTASAIAVIQGRSASGGWGALGGQPHHPVLPR